MEGVRVIYSLAGVTRQPIVPTCEVRIGGFGGVEGLQRYLEDARIDAVLDATHPYAARMAMHAAQACGYGPNSPARYLRPAWEPGEGDKWTQVASAEEALPHLAGPPYLPHHCGNWSPLRVYPTLGFSSGLPPAQWPINVAPSRAAHRPRALLSMAEMNLTPATSKIDALCDKKTARRTAADGPTTPPPADLAHSRPP